MRRPLRIGLATAGLLLVLCAGYAAFWFIAAAQMESGIGAWADAQKKQGLDLSWRRLRVRGFPFSWRVAMREVRLRDVRNPPGGVVEAPLLSASTAPWSFLTWRLTAPHGLTVIVLPTTILRAKAAAGNVALKGGGAAVWLHVAEPAAQAIVPLGAKDADIWLNFPSAPPRSHADPALGFAVDARGLTLPVVPAPFLNPLDEIAFGATVMGTVPPGPPRQAAAAWRDAGGTVELDHFALRWGALAVTGSGTLALDSALQPIGGFSGAIEGYDQLMSALVAAGRLHASDAGLARLALAMLARAGPEGRPEISTSFTIQNGTMYLGPVRLGPAPRIAWQ